MYTHRIVLLQYNWRPHVMSLASDGNNETRKNSIEISLNEKCKVLFVSCWCERFKHIVFVRFRSIVIRLLYLCDWFVCVKFEIRLACNCMFYGCFIQVSMQIKHFSCFFSHSTLTHSISGLS